MKNYLNQIAKSEILNMVHFVVSENYKHHAADEAAAEYGSEIEAVHEEELAYYENSEVFVAKDTAGSILGTIRVLKWNQKDELPIQKIFDIDPMDHLRDMEVNDIFHFGRLAIKKEGPSLQLFKKLIVSAIIPVCQHPGNVAFAECDAKLLKVLALLGIEMTAIGEPIEYLGSETIPVMIKCESLVTFLYNYLNTSGDDNIAVTLMEKSAAMFRS